MNKEKQIEEIAKVLCEDCARDASPCSFTKAGIMCDSVIEQAEALYNAGYRKSEDVAREIFEEIEQNLNDLIKYYKEKRKYATEVEYSEFEQRYCDIKVITFEERLLNIAELKKKYTESEDTECADILMQKI